MKKKNLNEKLESLISKIALEGTKGRGSITGLTEEDKEAILIALRKARDFDSLEGSYRDLIMRENHSKEDQLSSVNRKKRIALALEVENLLSPPFHPLDPNTPKIQVPKKYEIIDRMILEEFKLKRPMSRKTQAKLSRDEQNKIDRKRAIHDGHRKTIDRRIERAKKEIKAAYERGDLYPIPEWWEFGLELIYKNIIESEKNWD